MTSTLQVSYIDKELNALLENLSDTQPSYSMHFNHNEEFFLELSESFDVPHLPIHHDVRLRKPDSGYIDGLKHVISQLVVLAPDLFRRVTYFFDPEEIFKPRFFSLYRLEDKRYLYMLELDLMYRAQESGIIEKGSNDISPHFRSSHLYAEGIVIPLENVSVKEGTIESFQIRQTLAQLLDTATKLVVADQFRHPGETPLDRCFALERPQQTAAKTPRTRQGQGVIDDGEE